MSEASRNTPAPRPVRTWWWGGLTAVCAALLTACGSTPSPTAPHATQTTASMATTARAYRADAARHLYAHNAQRIYSGQLPPMLYAIGVLEVHLDRQGGVRQLHWLRAPRHAPEVVQDIERTVRAAAPFPAPTRVSDKLVYTDTWLWDKSGRFQLDTLSEGQRSQ